MLQTCKILKSINQFYNKELARLQSLSKGVETRRIARLTRKRNNKVDDFMHKSSRYVIDYCIENNIDTIVLGYNQGWKQDLLDSRKKSAKYNQKFGQIPFYKFKQMLDYKARDAGIKLIITEESYTSGTSFLDYERPVRGSYNKSRRIHRGLFKSNQGHLINADINASYQIAKKVFENIYDSIEGLAISPVRVNPNKEAI